MSTIKSVYRQTDYTTYQRHRLWPGGKYRQVAISGPIIQTIHTSELLCCLLALRCAALMHLTSKYKCCHVAVHVYGLYSQVASFQWQASRLWLTPKNDPT